MRGRVGHHVTHSLIMISVAGLIMAACTSTPTGQAERQLAVTPAPPTSVPVTTAIPIPTLGPAVIRQAAIPQSQDRNDNPWYRSDTVGEPWGTAVHGVLTFRGSPNRTYQGSGPVPVNPRVQWSYPNAAMCSLSSDPEGEREWCGTGWTGQPAVWERGRELWVAFGAYDRAVHVLDAESGGRRMDPFVTGDLIKGTLTVDPDGHPLIYVGSRDNRLRVLSFDQGRLVELWSLDALSVSPSLWNDDWDGSPVVIDDHLFIGGENSNFHIVRLHRGYDEQGWATVAPELISVVPGWDSELLAAVGDNVSIENSVTIVDDIVYFANSGGLVQGWDIAPVRDGGQPTQTLRFWMGDDTDATIVVDDEGYLYAASEYERANERSRSLGQVVKLDPRQPDQPVVWAVDARSGVDTGVWATLAVHRDLVVVPTADGRVLGLDRMTGETRWTLRLPGPLWSSPVIVDDVLVQGDCGGVLHGFDLSQTKSTPTELWSTPVGGCIESTPVVWKGRIWVGTRSGFFHMISDG